MSREVIGIIFLISYFTNAAAVNSLDFCLGSPGVFARNDELSLV